MEELLFLKKLQGSTNWLFASGLKIALVVVAALTINSFARRFLTKALRKAMAIKDHIVRADKEREETIIRVFSNSLSFIVWTIAFLILLPEFGVDIKTLLAGVGIFGLAIGMGAQQIIRDYLSGLFIVLEDHYRVGDEVEIGGKKGKVADINFRRTIIKDEEGLAHFIPHSEIKIISRKIK